MGTTSLSQNYVDPKAADGQVIGADTDRNSAYNLEQYAKALAAQAGNYTDMSAPTVGANTQGVAAAKAKVDAAQAAYDAVVARETANGGASSAQTSAMGARMDPVTGQTVSGRGPTPEMQAAQDALNAARAELTAANSSIDPSLFSAPGTKVNAPADVTATTVAPTSIDFNAGLVDMARQNQIGPAGQVAAQSVGPVAGVQAQQIAGPGGITAGTVTAPTIAGSSIDRSSIANISLDGSVGREAQLKALQQLQDAAEGKTTSAAEWLLQKGIDENVGAAYGIAASLQGRNTGGALRAGHIAAKDAIAKSAADMGALRAKEQADARTAFANLGTAMSETDYKAMASNQTKDLTVEVNNLNAKIQVAMKQAELAERAGETNVMAKLQGDIASMQAQVDVAKTNAQLSLAADTSTMIARLDASKADAANRLTADITNSQQELTRLMANQKAMMDAGRADQADALQAEITRSQQSLEAQKSNQLALLEAAKATASNQLTAGTESAKLAQANQQFNAGQGLDINKTQAQLDADMQKTNEAIRLALEHEAASALLGSTSVGQKQQELSNQQDAAYMNFIGSLVGSGGTIVAGA